LGDINTAIVQLGGEVEDVDSLLESPKVDDTIIDLKDNQDNE
jgi:hypothetical protein